MLSCELASACFTYGWQGRLSPSQSFLSNGFTARMSHVTVNPLCTVVGSLATALFVLKSSLNGQHSFCLSKTNLRHNFV
jgi:hypothetical protein